jgi:alpha-beta hydrolase superfamily lysophospholipase
MVEVKKMERTEGTFKGDKGLNLFYQCWLPNTNPKAVLLIVPGLAEHSGRYTNVVNYFVPKAYAVCGLDTQGHGKSDGLRCYIDRFSDYIDDIKIFFDIVHQRYGDRKIFMVGHSMGATIALAYAVQHQRDLAGLIISGVGLKPGSSISPVLKRVVRLISFLFPKMGVTVLDATAISQDKAVVDAYIHDPLVHRGKITARLGAELLKTIDRLPSQIPMINLPIIIMQGTEDLLCNPEGSPMVYDLVGSRDKTLKLYEGFHHEIFNEPGHLQVMADLEAWLATRA